MKNDYEIGRDVGAILSRISGLESELNSLKAEFDKFRKCECSNSKRQQLDTLQLVADPILARTDGVSSLNKLSFDLAKAMD